MAGPAVTAGHGLLLPRGGRQWPRADRPDPAIRAGPHRRRFEGPRLQLHEIRCRPIPSYTDLGDRASTDGVYAGAVSPTASRTRYRLAEVGDEISVAVTVDLGKTQEIACASHHNCGAGGYRPDEMSVSVSTDGQAWTQVGRTDAVINGLMMATFAATPARYVRFEFTKRRIGASDDWLFLDELEVY